MSALERQARVVVQTRVVTYADAMCVPGQEAL